MGHPANVIPLRCADADSYDPDALRLGPDDIPAAKVDTGTRAKRKAARDRLFIPSTAWPEFAAVVAAGMSGRAWGCGWRSACRPSSRAATGCGCARTCARAWASPTAPPTPGPWPSWSGPG